MAMDGSGGAPAWATAAMSSCGTDAKEKPAKSAAAMAPAESLEKMSRK